MKRDRDILLVDRAAQESDARLRRTSDAGDVAGARAERVERLSKAQSTKFRQNLSNWQNLKISLATEFELSAPEQIPVGPQFFVISRPASSFIFVPHNSYPTFIA